MELNKMITYKKVDRTYFLQYDQIPMIVHVSAYYRIDKDNWGLGGFTLVKTPVEPYIKDFCVGDDESITRWEKRWDISNWAFFMAFDEDQPVGGATVVSRTKEKRNAQKSPPLSVIMQNDSIKWLSYWRLKNYE